MLLPPLALLMVFVITSAPFIFIVVMTFILTFLCVIFPIALVFTTLVSIDSRRFDKIR